MPLYEYKCEDCGEEFFELRPMREREEPIACPDCGGAGQVLISQVSQGNGAGESSGRSCAPGGT